MGYAFINFTEPKCARLSMGVFMLVLKQLPAMFCWIGLEQGLCRIGTLQTLSIVSCSVGTPRRSIASLTDNASPST